jgi:hypothetical protein
VVSLFFRKNTLQIECCYLPLERQEKVIKIVSTTMVYTHVLNKGGHGVKSPVDMFVAGLD